MQQPVSGRHLAAIIIMHFWKEKSHYNTSIFLPPSPKTIVVVETNPPKRVGSARDDAVVRGCSSSGSIGRPIGFRLCGHSLKLPLQLVPDFSHERDRTGPRPPCESVVTCEGAVPAETIRA